MNWRFWRRPSRLEKEWTKRLEDEGTPPGEASTTARICVERGLHIDFELPYPEPRNEHEEAFNYVSVNPVISGRTDA